jgi:integrase
MSSLQAVALGHRTLLLEDGVINVPFSIYLQERYTNPNTREAAATALRVLHRFLVVFGIDLPRRALEGECLRSVERGWLAEVAYRPVAELEQMNANMMKRLVKTRSDEEASPADIKRAVVPNTAAKRLFFISEFLTWYKNNLLDEAIRSTRTRNELDKNYAKTCAELAGWIGGTSKHANQVRSLPVSRYLEVIQEVFLNPEHLFKTPSGHPSSFIQRDRAMALLAAEGLRPGAIGNLAIDDFRYKSGEMHGYVVLKDNVPRRRAPFTAATPTVKGIRSTKQNYNSNIEVRIQPFTCLALRDYIDGERAQVLGQDLINRSQSFLFLAEHGGPFEDRSSISHVFNRLGIALKELKLLNVAQGDPFVEGRYYQFSAYTLRHSAASYFYSAEKHNPNVKDQMRTRFGWTKDSNQPDRYANRAMSETASVNMNDFYQSLLDDLKTKRLAESQRNKT